MPPVVEGRQAEVPLGRRGRTLVEPLGEEHSILLLVGMAQALAEDNDVNDLLRKLVVRSMPVVLRLHMDSPRICLVSAYHEGN
jgi:hypothetical protein